MIPGGTDRLPEAFASGLADLIRFGTEALRLEQDADGVRLVCRGGGRTETLEGDRTVSPLPYSTITRIYVQVARRFWEDRGFAEAA